MAPTSGCTLYVANSGVDTNDGSTWAQALANVQPALDMAASKVSAGACSSAEVWVAAGTYKPTYQTDGSDLRTATFQLAANVTLYGGFSGTESTLSARSVANNVTTLSGDIGIANDTSDNSYHVVTGVTGATIDGFTITGGNADAEPGSMIHVAPASCGGGMFNAASLTVTNCTFSGNHANEGGAMCNYASSPIVTNCTFSNNSANQAGGGLYNDSSSLTVKDCTFSSNSATAGGGMYDIFSSSTVTGCTFSNNSATEGGGMSISGSSNLTNCTFSNNSATNWGGGIYISGQALPATVTNCTFNSNRANYGGGIANECANSAVSNCTFFGNSAEDGGAMYHQGASNCYPTVIDTIFWSNTASIVPEFHDATSDRPYSAVSHSIVEGGYTYGTDIIDQDPMFVDAASGKLQLRLGSPAIDQGAECPSVVPSTDQDGGPRWDIASVANAPGTAGVDIGAHEFQGNSTNGDTVIALAPCGTPPPSAPLSIVQAFWGNSTDPNDPILANYCTDGCVNIAIQR